MVKVKKMDLKHRNTFLIKYNTNTTWVIMQSLLTALPKRTEEHTSWVEMAWSLVWVKVIKHWNLHFQQWNFFFFFFQFDLEWLAKCNNQVCIAALCLSSKPKQKHLQGHIARLKKAHTFSRQKPAETRNKCLFNVSKYCRDEDTRSLITGTLIDFKLVYVMLIFTLCGCYLEQMCSGEKQNWVCSNRIEMLHNQIM